MIAFSVAFVTLYTVSTSHIAYAVHVVYPLRAVYVSRNGVVYARISRYVIRCIRAMLFSFQNRRRPAGANRWKTWLHWPCQFSDSGRFDL